MSRNAQNAYNFYLQNFGENAPFFTQKLHSPQSVWKKMQNNKY